MLWMFFLLLVLIVGGYTLSIKSDKWEIVGISISILSMIAFFTFLIVIPIKYLETKSLIIEHGAFVHTLENARRDGMSEFERIAITQKILEMNMDIGKKQYWNGTILGIYIPDEVMGLEMIE